MSHRQVLEALSGLLLAMFVAMVSSTVVTNALPRIVTDLQGSQTGYTWVVVATLLTMTATTPIWGKLADLFSKKLLVQVALVVFTIGSLVAASAQSMGVLIGARAIQGLGVGGLTALVQADLEPLSLAELETRIAVLEQEIGRTRRHMERATRHRASADALFKR